jgi:L-lactate dehydrogenase (cytochrome)
MARDLASWAINIEDLRKAAERRLPRSVFDYIDGGAEAELTLHANCDAYRSIAFRPRFANALPACDLRTTVLGHQLSMPILLAPVGSSRMFYPRGEEAAANAAGAAGTVYILSTLSGCLLEDVKRATSGPAWYQLYLCGGRDVAMAAMDRARKAGYSALVVTIDTPVAGMRERDFRNGVREIVARKPGPMLPYVGQFLSRPRWLLDYVRDGGMMKFPNVVLPDGPMPYADVGAALEQAAITWRDFDWIRSHWTGPIVVKAAPTTRGGRWMRARAPSSCRITADVSSTASGRRSACCRTWCRRWEAASKCCSTAASAAARTSRRRCASARAPS